MEIFTLRCFVELARCGSFTKTAERLLRTQPAISQQIASMEEELGILLVDRSTYKPRISNQGMALLPQCVDILARVDGLGQNLVTQEELRGQVRLGAPLSLISGWLPTRLASLLNNHPKLELELINIMGRQGVRQVRSGVVDLALTWFPESLDELNARLVETLDWVCISPHGRPFSWDNIIHFEEGADLRIYLEAQLANTHNFHIKLTLPTFDAITSYVAAGLGSSIVPHFVLGKRTDLEIKPLDAKICEPLKVYLVQSNSRLEDTVLSAIVRHLTK